MTAIRLVRLQDVCTQDRKTIKAGDGGNLRYIGLETIEANTGQFLNGELSKTPEVPQANSFRFSPKHVLYGKLRPYLNKVALPDFEGKCSTEIIPLLPKAELERAYLAYFLRSSLVVSQITKKTAGSRMPRADMDFVLGLQIPLPPTAEQRRIVDILSRAEGIVRLRREAQKKAAAIIPALFLDMFGDPATNPKGWTTHRLGDLALNMSDGPFGSNLKTSHYTKTGVRVIRLQNVGIGVLNDEDQAFVSPEHFATLPKHCCLPGDVIIATLGDPNLRAIVLPPNIQEALNKADCVQFRCNSEIVNPDFVSWLMNIPSVLDMAASMIQGITRTRISMGRLREIRVPVPPIELQRDFSENVSQTRSLQSQQTTATQKAETAFNALLSSAFTNSDLHSHLPIQKRET